MGNAEKSQKTEKSQEARALDRIRNDKPKIQTSFIVKRVLSILNHLYEYINFIDSPN